MVTTKLYQCNGKYIYQKYYLLFSSICFVHYCFCLQILIYFQMFLIDLKRELISISVRRNYTNISIPFACLGLEMHFCHCLISIFNFSTLFQTTGNVDYLKYGGWKVVSCVDTVAILCFSIELCFYFSSKTFNILKDWTIGWKKLSDKKGICTISGTHTY